MKPKILVAGAGAIGGITGGLLTIHGYDVTLFDVDREHVESMKKRGLIIEGMDGRKIIRVKAVRRIVGKYDVVFIAVKSQYTKDVLRRVIPHLAGDGIVVSLQNGINEEVIADAVGIDRTIGCVIGWSATNMGSGRLAFTSRGNFIIGKMDGKIDEKIEMVKEILEKVAPVEISSNILSHLWTKLLINSAIASIGAICSSSLGKIARNRKCLIALAFTADELVRIAERAGIKLEKFEGMDPSFFKIDGYDDFLRSIGIIKMAAKRHSSLKSTILQDLEKGRKTEIEWLNGYIERMAEENGIKTVLNKKIIEIIKEMESGKRKIGQKNIDEIYSCINVPQKWLKFKNREVDNALLNLPYKMKWENAVVMGGTFLMGSAYAFSRAFARITNSFLGKIFIRKNEWEIVNEVLSKFLENVGMKVAEKIENIFEGEKLSKSISLVFNNLGMENEMVRDGIKMYGKCIFLDGAEMRNEKEKIEFPVCIHLINGMNKKFGEKYELKRKKCYGDEICEFKIGKKL